MPANNTINTESTTEASTSEQVSTANTSELDKHSSNEIPLELQSLTKGLRTSAIIMVLISVISIYFIPWAVFYIILATKLNPKKVPNRKLVKATAIATLPLCLGFIPIIIDVEFWRMNRRLKEYTQSGAGVFKSDEEFLAGEPKRKKNRAITLVVTLSVILIFIILIVVAVITSSSSSTSTSGSSLLSSETIKPYVSSEHGFTVEFPGFPATEHSTLDVNGVTVPYTYYSKELDNGSKSYGVQVVNYPTSGFKLVGQERGALDGAINGMAQNSGATIISSSNNDTFQGYPSAEASFSINEQGQTYTMYSLNFIKGNDMYVLMAIGENESVFKTFTNSFRFN